MSSYLFELLIWALGAYVIGCLFGCWGRKLFSSEPEVVVPKVAAPMVTPPKVVPPPPPAPPKVMAPPPPPPPKVVVPPPPPKVVVPPPPPKVVAPPPPPPVVKAAPAVARAAPLATVRAGTTQLQAHVTRKAEEVHYDKNVRHVEGVATDRKVETRHGTHSVSQEPHRVAQAVQGTVRAAAPAPAPVRVATAPAVTTTTTVSTGGRPKGLAAARGGKPDDLQRISGVGPKNEQILHKLGIYHFDQIAAWDSATIAWVDDHLKFGGRVLRENWTEQAGLLASGKEAEFTRLYGTGGLKNAKGETQSGTKTRK